jgi:hypothetical protein
MVSNVGDAPASEQNMKTTVWVSLCLFLASSATATCTDRAQLLILGVYHMDNPGQDAVNLQADDVRSPKRQRELDQLIEKLARFQPTKIAIEAPYRNDTWPERYKKYLAGDYVPGRNEIEQIGFRLAKKLGHPTLYPVDYPMWMNGWTPSEMELARPNPKWDATSSATTAPAPAAQPEKPLSEEDRILQQSTITEYLLRLNSTEMIEKNHSGYLNMLLPADGVGIYAKTDLVTNWYKRNLRIFTNINRIAQFPQDRILLIIGAGHVTILNQLGEAAPYFCPVSASDYLR